MVATIAKFLHSTGKTSLVPLCYFSDQHANTPMDSSPARVKPNIIVVPLVMVAFKMDAFAGRMSNQSLNIPKKQSPPPGWLEW